jgi:predicted secreted protein
VPLSSAHAVNPRLVQKAVITTILATVVFAVFYLAQTRGFLSLESLPFYNMLPSSI